MVNNENQLGLFSRQATTLNLPDADVEYMPDFYTQQQGFELYQTLLEEMPWRQETIRVYGKAYLTPRLSCWMGNAGLNYRYSNTTMSPVAWSATLNTVKTKVEQAAEARFNSVLINYYRDGQDGNAWHSDDEPELGVDPVIASLSLGAERDFDLRHKHNKQNKHRIRLENGSLLVMRGTTQRYWQHQIPKRARCEGRINLTFRQIVVSE